LNTGKPNLLDDELLANRLQELASPRSPIELRLQAIRIMGGSTASSSLAILSQHLEDSDNAIVGETIKAIGRRDSPEFTGWLLSNFATASKSLRPSMFKAIRNQPQRLGQFITALESNQISTRLLDAGQLQSLKTVESPDLKAKVDKLLASTINENRDKLVIEYSEKLRGREVGKDPTVGKALFKNQCAGCHQVEGIGIAVGPNISDSREHTYEKLLVAILDPNRAIDANYFRYLALTEDGETVDGLLRDSNAQSVILESQNGVKRVLNRSELTDFKSSNTSMMPEGLESQISVDQMGELLWYLKNWRYVVDNVPAVAKLP